MEGASSGAVPNGLTPWWVLGVLTFSYTSPNRLSHDSSYEDASLALARVVGKSIWPYGWGGFVVGAGLSSHRIGARFARPNCRSHDSSYKEPSLALARVVGKSIWPYGWGGVVVGTVLYHFTELVLVLPVPTVHHTNPHTRMRVWLWPELWARVSGLKAGVELSLGPSYHLVELVLVLPVPTVHHTTPHTRNRVWLWPELWARVSGLKAGVELSLGPSYHLVELVLVLPVPTVHHTTPHTRNRVWLWPELWARVSGLKAGVELSLGPSYHLVELVLVLPVPTVHHTTPHTRNRVWLWPELCPNRSSRDSSYEEPSLALARVVVGGAALPLFFTGQEYLALWLGWSCRLGPAYIILQNWCSFCQSHRPSHESSYEDASLALARVVTSGAALPMDWTGQSIVSGPKAEVVVFFHQVSAVKRMAAALEAFITNCPAQWIAGPHQ
ncbi:uncharacterized protein F5891DRAFT_991495 [Suillus fuscotomentosus]|uniref:Uncharacterized protein n=1 Tax=Suillus fuscotomentosus TaxID=1912939 RepID=A0AAD4HBG0_9AGAM|nr:uncharacterized protein F5891DRAFT_991495 [Suillus fuscotomentosus]KAG1879940.1 hypothetical protein F5891DRAFT_991495 [Suillus fuscotomentosus]